MILCLALPGLADTILVNSRFTASIFRDTFKTLARSITPAVLYPSLNFSAFEKDVSPNGDRRLLKEKGLPDNRSVVFLSINRYERKKNLALAVNAMKEIKDACSSEDWERIHLIMAGKSAVVNANFIDFFFFYYPKFYSSLYKFNVHSIL